MTVPGRNEARTGLRMMPTFPRSSLKFRKAGFPRYGFKAGKSGGAFLSNAMSYASNGLPPPVVHSASLRHVLVLSRGSAVRLCTSVQAAIAALPQGSSLRSGL